MNAFGETFGEVPKAVAPVINLDKNFGFVDRYQPKLRITLETRKRGKAVVWTTLDQELHFEPMTITINLWNINDVINSVNPKVYHK